MLIFDGLQVYFGMLDALMASEELPEEYRNRCQVKIIYIYIYIYMCSFYWMNDYCYRTYYAMIVIKRGMLLFTGYTTSVEGVDHTTRESSKLIQLLLIV